MKDADKTARDEKEKRKKFVMMLAFTLTIDDRKAQGLKCGKSAITNLVAGNKGVRNAVLGDMIAKGILVEAVDIDNAYAKILSVLRDPTPEDLGLKAESTPLPDW